MEERIPGFRGEFLWELDIARIQLLALAAAVPEAVYGWRPTEGARSFSAVLVHIAAGNILLLHMAGRAPGGVDLYGALEGDPFTQMAAMVGKNISLERTLTGKQDVAGLLAQSFDAVRESFTACAPDDLERAGEFFGELTTVRRVFLRLLTHTHEHMGQAIAYARATGAKLPWPDPLADLKRMMEDARARKAAAAV